MPTRITAQTGQNANVYAGSQSLTGRQNVLTGTPHGIRTLEIVLERLAGSRLIVGAGTAFSIAGRVHGDPGFVETFRSHRLQERLLETVPVLDFQSFDYP